MNVGPVSVAVVFVYALEEVSAGEKISQVRSS